MKTEKAYSIESFESITAQKADELFQNGTISSKFLFKCPDKNCDAQITCANLDKPVVKRKRAPYFKYVSAHSFECLIEKDIEDQLKKKGKKGRISEQREDSYNSNAVKLNLIAPSNKRPEKASDEDRISELVEGVASPNEYVKGKHKIHPSKTLSSMVDTYLNNESFIVDTNDGEIPLNQLFVEVNGQDIYDFPDENRIYYGKAWFNKVGDNIMVKFGNKLTCEELSTNPTFFISSDDIANSSYQKFNRETITALCDKKPRRVFIHCELDPYKNYKKPYINFKCGGLEYIDYRNL